MAFLIKFNMPPQLCGKLFFFHIFDSCLVSKHIYGHTRRNQPLVPLQQLSQQCHETRWRHHTDFSSQYLGSYCSLFLLVTFIWIYITKISKTWLEGFPKDYSPLRVLLSHNPKTVSQWPLLISTTKLPILSTIFKETVVSYKVDNTWWKLFFKYCMIKRIALEDLISTNI